MINKDPKQPNKIKKHTFSEETLRSLAALGVILLEIRVQQKAEENAKISKHGDNENTRQRNNGKDEKRHIP